MRIAIRIIIGGVLLVVVALGALTLALPRIVEGEEVRERIDAAAREFLGREARYARLEFGLFPPSLVVVDATLAGGSPDAPPMVEARRVALRVALIPLLARVVVIESLVVEHATVRLDRSADGLVIPQPQPAAPAEGASKASASDSSSTAPEIDIALRGLELRDVTLQLRDTSVSPAVDWELRDVVARITGRSLSEPFDFSGTGELTSGGHIGVEGHADLSGRVELTLDFEALVLAPLAPYVDALSELSGTLAGTVSVKGESPDSSEVSLDVVIEQGVLRAGDISVLGKMAVVAELDRGEGLGRGSFRIDATDAEASYSNIVTRPVGEPKSVTGEFVLRDDGTLGIEDWKLNSGPFDAHGSAEIGDRVEVVVSVPPVDLAELRDFVPSLAEYEVSGPFRLDELTVRTSPLEIRGDIALDGVRARLPDGAPIVLRGGLVAEGTDLHTRDLELVAADQTLIVEGSIENLAGEPRYRIHTEAKDVETNALLSALTDSRDKLFGPLQFRGDATGLLAGTGSFFETLQGDMRFDITPGRMVGVSLLKAAFDQFDPVGLARLLPVKNIVADIEKYDYEDFESLSGTVSVQRGVARTDDLRLVYRDYRVELAGTLELRNLAIDMSGAITLGPRIAADLSKVVSRLLRQSPDRRGEGLVVPLLSVRGTLTDPKVRADFRELIAGLLGSSQDPVSQILKGLGVFGGGDRRR